jgi:hypothetical protein
VDENPTVSQSRQRGKDLTAQLNTDNLFLNAIRHSYTDDSLFTKVLANPDDHKSFQVINRFIWAKNQGGEKVLAVPKTKISDESIFGRIIDQAYTTMGHFGLQRTVDYI